MIRILALTGLILFSWSLICVGITTFKSTDACLSSLRRTHWIDTHFDGMPNGGSFVVPNERNTRQLAQLITEPIHGGLYLTVGTERGLIGACIHKSSGLIWVDRNPQVVAYNYFVRALIAISNDRKDFLKLRLEASMSSIQERALNWLHKHPSQTDLIYPLFSNKFYPWWETMVRKNSQWDGFDRKLTPSSDFGDNHYLQDDQKFLWIQNLIREGNTFILPSDLMDQLAIKEILAEATQKTQTILRLVDLSNSWENGYLGHEKTVTLLNNLRMQVPKNNLMAIVFTYLVPTINTNAAEWRYYLVEMAEHPMTEDLKMVNPLNNIDLWAIMRNLTQMTQFDYHKPTKPTLNPKFNDW